MSLGCVPCQKQPQMQAGPKIKCGPCQPCPKIPSSSSSSEDKSCGKDKSERSSCEERKINAKEDVEDSLKRKGKRNERISIVT